MAQLGNVNIDGLSLSGGMNADLAGGMSVAAFNAKYAGTPGFQAINTSRQVGGAAQPAAAAAPAGPSNGPDSSALTNFASDYTAGYQAILDRQNAQQQGLFNQYTAQQNAQEKLPDLYKRLQNENGIPQISQELQGYKDEGYRVQNLLDRLDEDVNSRYMGTYSTQAMRDRVSNAEGGDLRTQLARLGTAQQPLTDQLTAAQNSVSTLLPLYTQQQEKDLEPVKMQIDALSDRFAREITGYTDSKQQTLTALLDQIQRGRQLADRDWDLAQQLAKEERDFAKSKQLATISANSNYLGSSSAAASTPQTYNTRDLMSIQIPTAAAKPAAKVATVAPKNTTATDSGNRGSYLVTGQKANLGVLGK